MAEPKASRPATRGYWRQRPLPWRWARERLTDARNYWVASTLDDGRALTRPVWGVWIEDSFYFDSGSRTGRNLLSRPNATVHLESGNEVVVVEGLASAVTQANDQARFLHAYNAKYKWDLTEPPGTLLVIQPVVAFGWINDPSGMDGGALFGSTGTRWEFGVGAT